MTVNLSITLAWWELPTLITILSIAWVLWTDRRESKSIFSDSFTYFVILGWVNTAVWIVYAIFN